jgi:hypothetical protein
VLASSPIVTPWSVSIPLDTSLILLRAADPVVAIARLRWRYV